MNKYGLQGKLRAKEGHGEQLAEILLKAAELVSTAKGCHLYLVSKDVTDKNAVCITEVWDSKEDHDHSLMNEDVRALIGQAMPILDGKPEKGLEMEVLGGAGIN